MKKKIIITLLYTMCISSVLGQKKDSIIVIQSHEHQGEHLYNDAVNNYNAKNYTEAIRLINLSLKENDTLADTYFLLAVIQKETGNEQAAIQTFLKYTTISPIKDTAYYIIAQIFNNDNKPDSASIYLKLCTEYNSKFYQAFYLQGLISFEKTNYEDAIHYFSKVIEIDPNYSEAYNDRGSAYRLLEKYNEAVEDYSKAIMLKKTAIYYNNRGSVKMKLEKYAEAIDDYTAAIILDSSYYIAINNRGVAKIEIKNYLGAINDFTLCLQKKKDYYAAISNRGIAYYKAKKYKEAIVDFDTIISINPSDATAYLHRGNTKEMIRDKEGACNDWQKAADLGIDAAKNYVKNQCNNQ